ncbi:cytochrome P450 [Pseudonocardia parietis]|uniref:Cytochrome P450 n=1 Tax=Pseudonocardia parietis TaxID=570936 RepID=A0ABS4VUD3_9PSEU|nr:cytochrome P450 [Pseudonocardia parietis]MBP2367532.1 cytochrome P450 [Pseudonocardia parietis]
MNSASTLVHLLLENPERQDRIDRNPGLAPRYVEELLRHRSPTQNFARRATCPTAIAGAAGRRGRRRAAVDRRGQPRPGAVRRPGALRYHRATRGHLGFGFGVHQCLGAALARAELSILLAAHPPLHAAGEIRWSGLQGGNHLEPSELHRLAVAARHALGRLA